MSEQSLTNNAPLVLKADDVSEHMERLLKLISGLKPENIQGLMLTVAEVPPVEELNEEQLAELKALGIPPGDATKVSHVLIGSLPILVHLFKATGQCIHETFMGSEGTPAHVTTPTTLQ